MILSLPARRLAVSNVPDPADSTITVPPTLQPTTELPGLLTTFNSGSGFAVFQGPSLTESGLIGVTRTQPASSATAQVGIANFLKGLYHWSVRATCLANFSPAVPLTHVQLTSAQGASTITVLDFPVVANIPMVNQCEFITNFADDFWSLDLQQGTTAVGNTIYTSLILEARRLA